VTPRVALVVSAHPDDEALGCGGTIARLAAAGVEVHLAFLSDGVNARGDVVDADSLGRRRRMGDEAAAILGARAPSYLDLPDNRLDSLDLLDVVVAVERITRRVDPDLVLTHSAADLNIDHRLCAQAVTTALRPMPGQRARALLSFEVASSTEWGFGTTGPQFTPDVFVDIEAYLAQKLTALDAYGEEMRAFPHPRSAEAIAALARWRGATAGVAAAEALQVVRVVI
jgi:LmbE family N-acetylglucosaminyl deacetylase